MSVVTTKWFCISCVAFLAISVLSLAQYAPAPAGRGGGDFKIKAIRQHPENYYAMKLQLVSQELPLKLELYKYLVLKGRQVQAGRVPIDVPVKNDTVFSIRLDVRGAKFNTYVQGQPVDVWTDDQLRSGGVGFLNERSERERG